MTKRFLRQTGEWPRFKTPDGSLRSRVYEHEDGRKFVHVASPGEMRTTDHIANGDTTKLIYRGVGLETDKALFLGMAVKRSQRGMGMGRALLDYFVTNIEEQEAIPLTGTGRIHKPIVALCLQKAGFIPRGERFMAELVPGGENQEVPSIRVLRNDVDPNDIVTGNEYQRFYNVIPGAGVEQHPAWSPSVVALHVTYAPPSNS